VEAALFEAEVRVATADGEMTSFVVHPEEDGPFPVAFLFMDGIGYRDQVKANARRFADAGYYVVAPDLFYRSGEKISFDFTRAAEPAYRERLLEVVAAVTPERTAADIDAIAVIVAADDAAGSGAKVCVGYCMGARVALRAAASDAGFAAAAGIHPSALVTDRPDSPHHDLARVGGELYFAFAENDNSATAENVDSFRAELERHGVRGVVERLPGTTHGFAMEDLPVYDRNACERHFERTLELWKRSLD
jgi:carboxymethylenebutenolidase